MNPPLSEREFRRILLIKPSSLGDIIQSLPVLEGLRRRYPGAHIAWLLANPFVELMEKHPALNEVIPFDRARYGRVGRSLGITLEFVRFVRDLRRRRFDLVVDLQGLFRSGFLAWVTRAAVRIGPGEARELSRIFYTDRYPFESMDIHSARRMWAVAGLLGFESIPMTFHVPIADADRAAIRERLVAGGLQPDQPYAVVFPAARWETKVWPAERFAAVIDRLATERQLPAVLLGSTAETDVCRRVAALCGSRPLNLAGQTTLRQLAAAVAGARRVLTNDSGPMHMADALDRPMTAVFGPTNPVRTGPLHQPKAVVRLDLPCSPCYLKHLRQCPYRHRCMQDLSVEEVFSRVLDSVISPVRIT